MNIKIQQAENSIENVDRSVISALYNAHINGDISQEVDNNNQKVGLVGSITAPAGYAIQVSTLNSAYPKFHVTVNSEYISFEDANVEQILLNIGLGDGVGITVQAANNAAFTSNTFKNNTTITSFNEFPYFTRANTNPPVELFRGCSNLEEIDLRQVSTLSASMFFEASKLNNITVGSVLEIPNRCFYRCYSLTSFDIPQSCSTLGPLAFRECTNLQNIHGLRNVQYFGAEALNSCPNLQIDASDLQNAISIGSTFAAVGEIYGNINMPRLISIDTNAFNRTGGIQKVLCLGKVSSIPDNCFFITNSQSNKVLQEVYLPKECTSIGHQAFAESNTLLSTIKQYNLSVDDPNWVVGENYGDITRVTSFGSDCFKNCSNLNIPASALQNATSIGTKAFERCSSLTGTLNLPSLISLSQSAFSYTGITSIADLGSITSIPNECFRCCTSLTDVTLPSSVTSIGLWSFADCHMTTMDLSHVTSIGEETFVNSYLTTADLSNVISIGPSAFRGSRLQGVLNMPKLTSLGNSAFQQTNITSVQNLGQVSEIEDPFWNCTSLTEIVLPTTLRKSGSFYNTHVSKLIYPYGFTEKISGNMCGGEQGRYLQYIQFPSTVTKIVCDDMYRDSGSSRIRCHIVVQATTPPNTNRNPSDTGNLGLGWSWGDPSQANWYVPDAVVNTYKADAQWSSIANYIFPISQLKTDSSTCWDWYQANKDYGVPNNN